MDKAVLQEYLFKEVELTQDIIGRMGNNSFLIKGATITLIAAALLVQGTLYDNFVALLPLFAFWYLDAYFLRIENLYRKLYGWLTVNRLNSEAFLLDLDIKSLEKRFGKEVNGLQRFMRSKTLLIFYGLLLLVIVLSILVKILL
jgi:hypothetical protein